MATLEQLQNALVKADAAGNVEDARAFANEIRSMQAAAPMAKPAEKPQSFLSSVGDTLGNIGAGAIRGAGSIGATILTPIDAAARAMGIENDYIGRTDRREAMDYALQDMGADPKSMAYQGGKLGAEIAGTLPIGGVLAKGASKVPMLAKNAPIIEALRTGGMSTGSKVAPLLTKRGAGQLATRVGSGATVGGTSAALVNPDDIGTGALIGAAMPGVVKVAGEAGMALGNRANQQYADALTKFNRGAPMRDTLKQSIDAGYVVPPNMVNPSLKNQVIESFSGKQATGQLASVKNQDVTEKLVRQSLGIADDAPLTKSALEQIRKVEGGAYKKVSDLSPQAEIDLEALKKARNDAQGWFNAYNRSASPDDLAKAKNFRDTAEVLELNLESHAKNAGKADLIPALRDARKQIAKTYTVERALNDATGTVNAKVIGRLYDKGKPLSDGLDTVGRFASGFPSVNQASQQMGSPGAHNLRAMISGGAGGLGALSMGPLGLAAAALPYAAGAGSRGLMFRQGAQKALANQQAPIANNARLAALLRDPELQQLLTRTAPVGLTAE